MVRAKNVAGAVDVELREEDEVDVALRGHPLGVCCGGPVFVERPCRACRQSRRAPGGGGWPHDARVTKMRWLVQKAREGGRRTHRDCVSRDLLQVRERADNALESIGMRVDEEGVVRPSHQPDCRELGAGNVCPRSIQ